MNWKSDPLWAALADMRIGPDTSGFTARLARENGWSPVHAEAVNAEYRRFLYLAARADTPATPSDDVDQAWHLHLLHSRHYWDELCARILRRPLHHDPAGADEGVAMDRQYETTLAHYRATFGEEPPATIWPPRLTQGPRQPLRIDAARYWLIPKLSAGRAAALGSGALLVAACSALAANAGASSGGSPARGIVAAIALTAILAVVCRLLMAGGGRGSGGKGAGSGCSAMFGGGDSSGHSGHGGHSGDGGHGCGSHGCGGGSCGGGGCGGH
jgi:hypothetical protein